MLPRRIVALGVGFALLVTLTFAATAGARQTLIHDGQSGSSTKVNVKFAQASNTTLVNTASDPSINPQGFLPLQQTKLVQYGCVVLPLNAEGISSFYADALKLYAQNGGTVVLVGEYGDPNNPYNGGVPNAVMNGVASGMGSTMQLNATTVDFGPASTTNIGADELTLGVTKLAYNATSTISLGAGAGNVALARASNNQPFIAVDPIGSGKLVMFGDSNVISDEGDVYNVLFDNATFVRNLCGDTSRPKVFIDNPTPNARYKQTPTNTTVKAFFHCTDEDDRTNPFYSDIAYCVGPFDNNTLIDLAVKGSKQFTVDAGDFAGNTASEFVNYTVDGTPPTPYITVPENTNYTRQGNYPAAFGCINNDGDPVEPTVTDSTAGLGAPIKTSATGVEPFSVTCTDSVGNSATAVQEYTVLDMSPPAITITTPAEGARFRLNQSVNAVFGCTDADGPADLTPPGFCTGPVANGGALPTGTANAPGTTTAFTVTASDQAGNSVNNGLGVTHHYVVDASPPDIQIVKPAAGAKYNKGAQLLADYSCSDPDTNLPGFDDVKSCNGPVAKGDTVDSSVAGTKTFKVDAQDQAGNTATKTNTYTILGTSPPSITIASPVDGATFKQGAAIPLSYSCSDPDGPQDIKSCTASRSAPLDSSKPGTFELTGRVEDFADNVRTKTHKYTVVAPGTPASSPAPSKSKATKVCTSRRKFTIRVKKKKGVRIVSATVTVNGKKVKTKKGKRFTSVVTLTGLKKGRYTVVIKAKLSDGRTVTDRRKFKTCTPKGK